LGYSAQLTLLRQELIVLDAISESMNKHRRLYV
jgi:hypothetical protein